MARISVIVRNDDEVNIRVVARDRLGSLQSGTNRSEGLGTNLDGRMFVNETVHQEDYKKASICDNLPHGMSPADL